MFEDGRMHGTPGRPVVAPGRDGDMRDRYRYLRAAVRPLAACRNYLPELPRIRTLLRHPTHTGPENIKEEVRLIAKRTRQVWHLVPRRHKFALGGAAAIMAMVGVLNTGVPILIGRLIQEMQRSLEGGVNRAALIGIAVFYLGGIALAYVIREFLKV